MQSSEYRVEYRQRDVKRERDLTEDELHQI